MRSPVSRRAAGECNAIRDRHIGARYLYLLRVHSTRWRRAWHVRLSCREDGVVKVGRLEIIEGTRA
jgi:hypothetical protein